jgi:hypothetical protein
MKNLITFILLLGCLPSAFAQRDNPVTGHAVNLVDLLKKDYSTIAPETRRDEISRDMGLVIALFKSYLADDKRNGLTSSTFKAGSKLLDTALLEYNRAKKRELAVSIVVPSMKEAAVADDSKVASKISSGVEYLKDKYYNKKYDLDAEELKMIKAAYSANKFLEDVLTKFEAKYKAINEGNIDGYASANSSASIQKSLPFIGGDLAFTMAVDGLSRFLAKRIKEELTTYVIEKVKVWLQNPSPQDPLSELKVLLPKTTRYLAGFTADKVTNFPNEIKQYIEDDLNHMLDNASALRNTPRVQRLIASNPNLDFAMEALELIPALSKIKYPTDYFTFLENSRNISRWKNSGNDAQKNLANSIYLTGLLARSLVVIDNGEPRFAGTDLFNAYSGEDNFYRLYAGFLYQQNVKYYEIKFVNGGKSLNVDEIMAKVMNDATAFTEARKFFMEILNKTTNNTEKIYNVATSIRKANKAGMKIEADTIYSFVESLVGFSEELVVTSDTLIDKFVEIYNQNIKPVAKISGFSIKKGAKPYFAIARSSNEVINDLHHKRYANALLKIVSVTSLLNEGDFNQLSSLTKTISTIGHIQYEDKFESWTSLLKAVTESGQFDIKDDKLLEAAKVLAVEVNQLTVYYRLNNNGDTLPVGLSNLKAFLISGSAGTLSLKDTTGIHSYLKSDEFKNLIVSYYTSTSVDKLIISLDKEMENFKIKVSDKDVTVFEDADRKVITKLCREYLKDIYRNYFEDGNKKEDGKLKEKRLALISTVGSYLSVLPQKLDIEVNPKVVSIIHFVNDMAAAKDAEGVEKAIEAFALPSGSYSLKRAAKFNFALNSYPGLLPAVEMSWDNGKMGWVGSVGFTAPVGVSLTWGSKGGDSDGIFIPLIDIGAVTRLRLDESNATKSLPELTFKNIFAPGLYYTHGFRRMPLSINIGCQYGPELIKLETDAEGIKKSESFEVVRIGLGIVLDIPLFNLHTKPR